MERFEMQPVKPEQASEFSPEEQAEIQRKVKMLSALAYFIGKDFRIPVELNTPGGGWHWDFVHNVIRVDPKTLLERPIDELRYLICHEGGHRRISRTDFIPLEVWKQPGFSAMSNFIEDPRNDNFVAESYPKYRENVDAAWGGFFEEEKKKTEEAAMDRLGTKPKFIQAGYEYIRLWFEEIQERPGEVSADLPEDVRAVVRATVDAARDSWWRYPSREEADKSEKLISEYARVSYEINRDKIWPEFKKLVESDLKDQQMQELLKDAERQGDQSEEGDAGLPKGLKDELTPKEQKMLGDAIRKAIEKGKKEREKSTRKKSGGKSIDLDSLSDELKKKVKEYIDSLPEDEKRELAKKAEAAFKEFEKTINEELQGRLADNPEKKAERDEEEKKEERRPTQGGEPVRTGTLPKEPLDVEGLLVYKERLERKVNLDENVYEKYRREVMPLIEKLEAELRQIFVERKVTAWKGGFKGGKRIDMKKRIQEKARQTPAMESRAWQKRERPDEDEKDHAVSLLNDLSGSMRGKTIEEDFKAKIVLAETLNKLGIQVEILGFNDEMYEYQNFGESMSKQIRAHMGGMFKEVEDSCCKGCGNEHSETDLGWAIKKAAERLSKQKAVNKMLIILTDGRIDESTRHPRHEFDPIKIKQEILEGTDIVPIDPGSIAGKTVAEIVDRLKERIIQII